MIYLDWAASAPPDPEALDTLRETSSLHFANPSSPHGAGRAARTALEEARGRLSRAMGGGDVVFTSGATESNAAVLLAQLSRMKAASVRGRRVKIVTSGIEHASIHEQARLLEEMGLIRRLVPPEPDGIVDPGRVAESLDEDTTLVSIMLVNNETGAVQKVREITRAVRDFSSRKGKKIHVHTDAAQGFGKIGFLPASLEVDSASVSAHKIGGPRGVGALWLGKGAGAGFLAAGGGQEAGRRPGTENLPGICAMAVAAEKRLAVLEEELEAARAKTSGLISSVLEIRGSILFPRRPAGGADAEGPGGFSPYIVSFGFPPLPGEVVVRAADAGGFLIGTGSACSSRKKSRTRVLEAMGVRPETALSAVRVSIGPSTTAAELERFADFLKREIPGLLATAGRRGS
jgi:cysteine desulfurase